MKKSLFILSLPLLLAGCGIARIVTVAPAPEQVVVPAQTTTVVVAQPQPQQTQVVYTRPVSTTVTYPRTHTTRTTIINVSPMTSDISLYLDLQAVAAAFAQANSVEEFEMILNSHSYMISNLDLNRDGFIDYLRVLEVIDGRTHVLLIQAVLAANYFQDVATVVVEMGFAQPYVQVIGAPYIYGANYIIEPIYYKRPPLFDRFGRPTYAYWRSPYYWDHFPHHYGHYEPYHLGHYQAYVHTYMEHHNYCHNVNYVDHYHYGHYADASRPMSRSDYAQQYPDQSFSRRTTATYIPAGSNSATRVTNARQLQQAIDQSGETRTTTATRTTTNQSSRTTNTTAQPSRSTTTTTTQQPTRTTTTTQSSRTTTTTSTTAQPSRTSTTTTAQPSRTSTQQASDRQASAAGTTTTRVRSTSGTTSTTRSTGTSSGTRSSGTSTSSRSTESSRSTGTSTNTRSGGSSSTRR